MRTVFLFLFCSCLVSWSGFGQDVFLLSKELKIDSFKNRLERVYVLEFLKQEDTVSKWYLQYDVEDYFTEKSKADTVFIKFKKSEFSYKSIEDNISVISSDAPSIMDAFFGVSSKRTNYNDSGQSFTWDATRNNWLSFTSDNYVFNKLDNAPVAKIASSIAGKKSLAYWDPNTVKDSLVMAHLVDENSIMKESGQVISFLTIWKSYFKNKKFCVEEYKQYLPLDGNAKLLHTTCFDTSGYLNKQAERLEPKVQLLYKNTDSAYLNLQWIQPFYIATNADTHEVMYKWNYSSRGWKKSMAYLPLKVFVNYRFQESTVLWDVYRGGKQLLFIDTLQMDTVKDGNTLIQLFTQNEKTYIEVFVYSDNNLSVEISDGKTAATFSLGTSMATGRHIIELPFTHQKGKEYVVSLISKAEKSTTQTTTQAVMSYNVSILER